MSDTKVLQINWLNSIFNPAPVAADKSISAVDHDVEWIL